MESPTHPSILSHRAGVAEGHESRTQFEKVAGIFVTKFTEKIAAHYKIAYGLHSVCH